MILTTKTPLRVSLFGGGTDYPAYFNRVPGAVIGFAIDKYIYISALKLGGYVDYKYRLSYSRLEQVDTVDAIEHPVVRTHPETGRKCLYVNTGFTLHIVGMEKSESDALLKHLYAQAAIPEYQCRTRCMKNSIAFGANRASQHYAAPDY